MPCDKDAVTVRGLIEVCATTMSLHFQRCFVNRDVRRLKAVAIRLMILSRATRATGGHYDQVPSDVVADVPISSNEAKDSRFTVIVVPDTALKAILG